MSRSLCILLILLAAEPALGVQVVATGYSTGSRADSVNARETALVDAFERACETAGVKIRSESALLDEKTLVSTTEVSAAGFIEGYRIIDAGWCDDGRYRVSIEAQIVAQVGDGLRDRPVVSLIIKDEPKDRYFSHALTSQLLRQGVSVVPGAPITITATLILNDLPPRGEIHYCRAESYLELNGQGIQKSAHASATGFGLSDEQAHRSAEERVATEVWKNIAQSLGDRLVGIERDYKIRVENCPDLNELLKKLSEIGWIKRVSVESSGTAYTDLALTTNRTSLLIAERFSIWDYQLLERGPQNLRFVYRPFSRSLIEPSTRLNSHSGSDSSAGGGLSLGAIAWILFGGLAIFIIIVGVARSRRR